MFSTDQSNSLLKTIMEKLGASDARNCSSDKTPDINMDKINLTPAEALVILGIIVGSLDVNSILIGREQNVEILLVGSLKQKTELEKTVADIGKLPFGDVLKAIIGNM
ncbi:hypothetical protein [Acetivibrio cellulolyticus]|uniref:hypothetical protein n=1 Tax=Acetivibrio cellulolyticus TaxID=35830 RepID=UPI0001E2CBB1|nr:hypothetical protein [Acetivibrio cellulolyticus]